MTGVGLRLDAFAARRDLDHREIAVLEPALGLDAVRAGLIAQALDHRVDVRLGDLDLRLLDLEPAVLAELDVRLHLEARLELHRRAFDERIEMLELRLADRLEALLLDRFAEALAEDAADDFFLDLLRETRADHARRDLAGTEARDLGVAAELVRDAVGLAAHQRGGDLDFDGLLDGREIFEIQNGHGYLE